MRVVSLLPSATELVAELGAHHLLVGRSHECDHPAELAHLPVLTAPRAAYGEDPHQLGTDAAAIDTAVRTARDAGEALYTLNADALAALQPDLIITQDLCDVCSIDLAAVQRMAAEIGDRTGHTPDVVSLNPTTVEGVFDDLLRVGAALDVEDRARERVVALRERLHHAQDYVPPFDEGHTLLFLEWTDPPYVAGHWNVQLIERAGAKHPWNPTQPKPDSGAAVGPQMAERIAGHSRAIEPAALAAEYPTACVIAPCGLNLEQTRTEADKLMQKPWFAGLPAVRDGRVALVDGNQMFNRPGPRLVDAFAWLVGWLHDRPEVMPDGFAWEPLR